MFNLCLPTHRDIPLLTCSGGGGGGSGGGGGGSSSSRAFAEAFIIILPWTMCQIATLARVCPTAIELKASALDVAVWRVMAALIAWGCSWGIREAKILCSDLTLWGCCYEVTRIGHLHYHIIWNWWEILQLTVFYMSLATRMKESHFVHCKKDNHEPQCQ